MASGQSNFIDETLTSENALVLKEQAAVKTVKDEPMMSSVESALGSGTKCKEPTMSGIADPTHITEVQSSLVSF